MSSCAGREGRGCLGLAERAGRSRGREAGQLHVHEEHIYLSRRGSRAARRGAARGGARRAQRSGTSLGASADSGGVEDGPERSEESRITI